MGILDGSLAQSIYDGFTGQLLTLTYYENTIPDSGGLDELGDATDVATVSHDGEGFVDEYSAFAHAQAGIPETDLKVCIFGKSIPGVTVRRDAMVKITGPSGSIYNGHWFQVRKEAIDPAGALWTCQSFEIEDPGL